MQKKFEANQTKIKGGCQPNTKDAPQESWSDLTLKVEKSPIHTKTETYKLSEFDLTSLDAS